MSALSKLAYFYWHHFQKVIASGLGMLALIDLTGYGDAITAIVGAKGYAAIRLVGAAAIAWRALQAKQSQPLPAPDPNAVRS